MTEDNIKQGTTETERCDSRETWIKVIGKLGRETQLHLDERYRSFQITDYIIHAVSIMLAILAIFNVYYVTVLYRDLNGIVGSMESMHANLKVIRADMVDITGTVSDLNSHISNMDEITGHMGSMTGKLGNVRRNMDGISEHMGAIADEMGLLDTGMSNIDYRFNNMSYSVSSMRYETRQMARPMSVMP
jgi:archaellum component FlaC